MEKDARKLDNGLRLWNDGCIVKDCIGVIITGRIVKRLQSSKI